MEQEDLKWATFIFGNCLQKSTKVFTWGLDFSSITTVEKGTEFHLMGNKIHGKVRIQHQDWNNQFQVTITPDDESEDPITAEDVMLENIISVIDDSIEHYYECHNSELEELKIAI